MNEFFNAIEKFIPINDKNKSTSKDWVNSKVRYKEKKMVKTIEKKSLIELTVYKIITVY